MQNLIFKDDVRVEAYTKKELIRFMMNNLHEPAVLCKWGRNGQLKIIDFNLLACRFLGFDQTELKQKNIYEIFTPESVRSAEKILNSVTYESDIWEAEISTKKGKKLQVEITNYKFSAGGIQILLSLKDITAFKVTFTNLKSYKKYFEISESLGKTGYWEYDLKSSKLMVSDGTRSIFGLYEDQVTISDIPGLGLVEDLNQIEKMLNGLIIIDTLTEKEFEICRIKDNSVLDIRSVAEFDVFENKIFGVVQDITVLKAEEKKLLEEKVSAEQKNSTRQAFISSISNEIYAPMNRITGYCQLLNQPELPSETREEYMEYINKSCGHLHKFVTDILDISRIGEEKSSLQYNHIFIYELLNETFIAWKPEAERKGIDILINLNGLSDKLTLVSDESKLNKIIANLTDNAIRFTSEGYVELGCLVRDSSLLFYVKDTGSGLLPSHYEAISELFGQNCPTSGQTYSATGLGLAISKYYLDLLGGSLWIDSTPGEGSTFYFTIPYSNESATVEENSIPKTENGIDVRTCLIVDKLEINFFHLKALLSPLGFRVLWAKEVDEAIYLSIIEPVEVVVMDINISDNNGYEAAKIIKRKRPDLLVFAQSDHTMSVDKEKAVQAGFDDVITNPVTGADFIHKMDSNYVFK